MFDPSTDDLDAAHGILHAICLAVLFWIVVAGFATYRAHGAEFPKHRAALSQAEARDLALGLRDLASGAHCAPAAAQRHHDPVAE